MDGLVVQIEKLKAELDEGKASNAQNQEDELIEMEKHHPEGNFFEGRGSGEDIPEFLRYDGLLRNWRLSKRECERAVNDVWIAKEEVRDTAFKTEKLKKLSETFCDDDSLTFPCPRLSLASIEVG